MTVIYSVLQIIICLVGIVDASEWVSKEQFKSLQNELEMFIGVVNSIREDNRNLKSDIKHLTEQNEHLISTLDELKSENSRIKEESLKMKKDISALTENDKKMRSVLRELLFETDKFKTALSDFKHSTDVLTSETNATKMRLNEKHFYMQGEKDLISRERNGDQISGNLENENTPTRISKASNSIHRRLIGTPTQDAQVIAFSACISHNIDRNIGQHHVFIYDVVQCNEGNGYNKNTGVFTAPVNGVYAFLWTIASEGKKGPDPSSYGEIKTELVLNSHPRALIHTDTESGGDEDEATGFVLLHLTANDILYIRSGTEVQGVLQQEYPKQWTFSGWKL